jgi:hypothetical protein
MAEPKTRPTDASVDDFLDAVANTRRRSDARDVAAMMHAVTGEPPVMWGTSIVGFGSRPTGKQAAWPVVALSPRSSELVLYLDAEIPADEFEQLGPHRRGVGCLYVKRLDDVDRAVLERLIRRTVERVPSAP